MSKYTLTNVRLSFPALFQPKAINKGDKPRYSAALLLNKKDDAAQIDAIRKIVAAVANEKWPNGLPKGLKWCVRDGSEKDFDGYGPDVLFITASNEHRVTVVDRDMTPLVADDQKPYAGCYVNAAVRFWAQDNEFGRRVNCQLLGVQFSRDGEAFGAEPFKADEAFQRLDPETTPGDEGGNATDNAEGAADKTELPKLPF